MSQSNVKFLPDNLLVKVENGTSLLDAASQAGITLVSSCGGKGSCGACKVVVLAGHPRIMGRGSLNREQIAQGICLSCQTLVDGDVTVEIPPESRLQEHQILTLDSITSTTNIGTSTLLLEDRENGCIRESEEDLLLRYGRQPLATKVRLQMSEPSLTDNAADWTRLQLLLKRVLRTEEKPITIPL
jgi:uncharacterized 2Fe-2S/4Fe-4S cluster protein (DUF4445 family)